MNFSNMNLIPQLLDGLTSMNIETPTEIQAQAIPKILADPRSHVIAQAKTGSGKTLAFAIPIVQLLDRKIKQVQAVIIVPTRELCVQVSQVINQLSRYSTIITVQVYGGVSINRQIQEIEKGAQIIVATPGRLIDIYNRGKLSFKMVKFVVLDEADRCLDMGFMPDIEYLLLEAMQGVNPRLFLFSATLFHAIHHLVSKFTKNEHITKINVSEDSLTVEECDQFYYLIPEFRDKYYHFVRIFQKERPRHSIIFVNTKKTAEWLYNRILQERKIKGQFELISGSLTQFKREKVLRRFRSHQIQHLIATDVAARGLDIKGISHVFNYDIPTFEENYVHRIGRTARIIGKDGNVAKGTAISLVLQDELALLSRIEGFMEKDLRQRRLPRRNQNNSQSQRYFRSQKSNNSRKYKNPKHFNKGVQSRNEQTPKESEKHHRRNFLY
ncbi:MAG: DEAD/DEAH box helicase [Candidatus Lokiarchaeota archaeon]|nr:DEAD/DEAH box helicase [Candidatus Harpocratesius repetitus]